MVWREQDPPATDVLLDVTVPFSGGGTPAYLEIDKLPDADIGRPWARCLNPRNSAERETLRAYYGKLGL